MCLLGSFTQCLKCSWAGLVEAVGQGFEKVEARRLFNFFIWIAGDPPRADNAVSKINTDDEIGPSTVTPLAALRASSERSEGSVAMGSEMLRFAQHDSVVIHSGGRSSLFMCIIGPYSLTYACLHTPYSYIPWVPSPCHNSRFRLYFK
jgi:hypothetical protein